VVKTVLGLKRVEARIYRPHASLNSHFHVRYFMKGKPLSIENRWDILYRDYPEIYDEFAHVPYRPKMIDILHERFNLHDKIIVDIGSGSGRSSIALARYAEKVIGVEPEESMRDVAQKNTVEQGLENIVYIDGRAEAIPLEDSTVDLVIALTATMYPPEEVIPVFIKEARRVIKPVGTIVSVDVAPGWYGGALAHVIDDPDADIELTAKHRLFVEEAGFSYLDVIQTAYYGSLEKIMSTYGFIFGEKVIEYLKQKRITSIRWKFRIYYDQH
jgi:ubiquinone/menaquinone biosynthesis C-methylase UbiE